MLDNREGFDLPQAINLFWPCIFAVVFRHSFLPQTSTLAWKDQTLRVKKVIGKLKQTFGSQWWNVAFGFGFHVWRPSRTTKFRFHGKEGSRSHCLSAIPVTNVRQFVPQTIRPRQLVPSIKTISPDYVDELSGANCLGGELSRFPSDACASGAFMFINWEVIILSS